MEGSASSGVKYVHEDDALVWRRSIETGQRIEFRAWDVRRERTGVHASVEIRCQGAILAWSDGINIGRDEDRVRMANSAHKHLESAKGVYPATFLKNDLDVFARGLDDAWLAATAPVMMNGSLVASPPSFVLQPYVIEGGGTILFAPPGRGKSYTLMLMQVALDAGLQTFWPVRQCRTLLINLERSARSVIDRLGNINQVLGLERTRPVATINARGRSLVDVARQAERYITAEGIGCVFVDSISRAGVGDLNDNQAANRIVDTLNRIAPSWLALAHTPRSDESHVFGGVHFDAGADVVVQLLSEQDEGGPLGLGLQITKNNDTGKWPMWIGALEFSELGLVGVRRARRGEFPQVESSKKMTMRETLVQHLLDVGASSATEIAQDTGFSRSNVAQLLSSDGVFVRAGRLGHRQLYGVRNGTH